VSGALLSGRPGGVREPVASEPVASGPVGREPVGRGPVGTAGDVAMRSVPAVDQVAG
jgi:hypothetical protein